ncbi:MAG: ribosomal RNA small subunit methyltransferase A [Tepidisphaera sp.]
MQTLAEIRELLLARGLSPKKALGQNFLIDQNLVKKLVDDAKVAPGDLVLEVGPGTGTLTEELLARGCRVIAAELDDQLAELLRERHADKPAFALVHGDCLADKRHLAPALVAALGGEPFKLVANLPYAAATPVMLTLMTAHPECLGMWVTIQREVADRLLATPGTDPYGTVSVVADAACIRHRIAKLPPECFWPRPDVDSAMIALVRRDTPPPCDLRSLADFAQFLLSKRRKQIGSVLGRAVSEKITWPDGITPTDRAENLTTAQFIAMMNAASPHLDLHDLGPAR